AGRTNRNYRLSAPGRSDELLLRINHPGGAQLGIDRQREREILELTSAADISRPYWFWDPRQRFVIFPYLPARTWSDKDLSNPEQLARLGPLLERLHALAPPDWPRRSYHAYLRDYWHQVEQAGLADARLARAWRAFEPRLEAFDRAPWTACLVHHDLIPVNILESPERLYLIDWEYAALGHRDIDIWT